MSSAEQVRLPTFWIAGAPKAGTEWLIRCLEECPDVFVRRGEVNYFKIHYHKGWEWFRSHFRNCGSVTAVGGKSPGCLGHPEAPGRIAQSLPDVKLLFVLRDPIERAYSHYKMELRAGLASEDVGNVLLPGHRWVEEGRYHQHLQRYLRFFPREQIHVFLYDDLKSNPRAFLRNVCRCLGVDSEFAPSLVDRRFHTTRSRPRYQKLFNGLVSASRRIQKLPGGRAAVEALRRSRWVDVFHALNKGPAYPPMTTAQKRLLADYYRDDIAALSQWLRRDVTSWLTRYFEECDVQRREDVCVPAGRDRRHERPA